tara:strand:- start:370 stop:708 length:339 start_codon:yes stop_codon:yes gene_type:complete
MEGLRILSEWDTRDPVRNLWRNVLIVAIEDLIKLATVAKRFNHIGEELKVTLEYFKTVGEDFDTVCELSGFDIEFVRGKVLKAINEIQTKENKYGKSYMSHMQGERVQTSTY